MKANIDKTFQVDQPAQQVWEFLSNPEKVVVCVPGAQLTEKVDDTNYKGKVSVKFGPVSAKYNGQISMDKVDDKNYEMTISGKGMDAKGKGSAGMVMNGNVKSVDKNNSEVAYNLEISVTGKLAQFGSRLIVDVSNQLADQFTQSFKEALAEEAANETASRSVEVVDDSDDTSNEVKESTETEQPAIGQPENDNSVNAFSLMWAVITGFFSRLFGSKNDA